VVNNRTKRGDAIWDELNSTYNLLDTILETGIAEIAASEIKALRGEEPRLLTKYDSYDSLPGFFKRHGLSILPTNRGSYVIGKFDLYHDIPKIAPEISIFKPRPYPDALKVKAISSEAAALNLLYSSGLLEAFANEQGLLPAVGGRMSAGNFAYEIGSTVGGKNFSLLANSPQIEIDAGYEGKDSLLLIEAKKDRLTSFNMRQVYFPYVTWQTLMDKKVRNVFLIHSGDVFELMEYEFPEPKFLGNMKLVDHRRFVLQEFSLTPESLFAQANLVPENSWASSGAPYPQADSVAKLNELISLLEIEDLDKSSIADHFGFNVRQSDYYCNALKFLGLADRSAKGTWTLTKEGFGYLEGSSQMQHSELARRMMRVPALRKYCLENRGIFGQADQRLESLIEQDFTHPEMLKRLKKTESDSAVTTFSRRKQTILAWAYWLGTVVG
jgi:hypothetical protein